MLYYIVPSMATCGIHLVHLWALKLFINCSSYQTEISDLQMKWKEILFLVLYMLYVIYIYIVLYMFNKITHTHTYTHTHTQRLIYSIKVINIKIWAPQFARKLRYWTFICKNKVNRQAAVQFVLRLDRYSIQIFKIFGYDRYQCWFHWKLCYHE